MNKLRTVCSHLTVILALMFLVFLVLDQFNPMMNFVDNNISRWLLAGLCLSSAAQSLLYWKADGRPEDR
ncbi:MAG: hypothetical protein IKO25_00990 [Clostridia bacterium]|nr:hypothetical protein [Clostridia bacterium]